MVGREPVSRGSYQKSNQCAVKHNWSAADRLPLHKIRRHHRKFTSKAGSPTERDIVYFSTQIADNNPVLVILVSFLLSTQIIDQNINADQEDPERQNGETPADVVAADQKNAGQNVTQKGNPAWCDLGVDHNGRC